MGPTLVFDKSFLHGLSVDESVWLHAFFSTNITPPFFMETLADLEKQSNRGRSAEEIVSNLANKTPSYSSKANVHHHTLLSSELLGIDTVDMRYGRPIIGSPRYVELEGKRGAIVMQTSEETALQRWQEGDFLDLERTIAKNWRRDLLSVNFDDIYMGSRKILEQGQKPKTFEQVKLLVDSIIQSSREEYIDVLLGMLGIVEESHAPVLTRWKEKGRMPFNIFSPYAAHVASVDLFFYIAMGSNLIAHERPSHKIDFSYFYYLPFCNVFASGDKLHASVAPFFMGKHQEFIWAADLKGDLNKLGEYYSRLPTVVLERGVFIFAQYPPDDQPFLISNLWDKYCPLWRKHQSKANLGPPRSESTNAAIANQLGRYVEGSSPIPPGAHVTQGADLDYVVIKRLVPAKQGKWTLFPPEIISASNTEDIG